MINIKVATTISWRLVRNWSLLVLQQAHSARVPSFCHSNMSSMEPHGICWPMYFKPYLYIIASLQAFLTKLEHYLECPFTRTLKCVENYLLPNYHLIPLLLVQNVPLQAFNACWSGGCVSGFVWQAVHGAG